MVTDAIGRQEVLLLINNKNYNFRKKNSQTVTDAIGRQEVLLLINNKNYNFRKKNSQTVKERETLHQKTDKAGVN